MDYALFVILNVILFVRPSEVFPALAEVPMYEIVIMAAIAAAFPKMMSQLSIGSLKSRPTSLFVVGLWFAVVFSYLFGMFYWTGAKDAGLEFGKVILYYLLLVGVLDRVSRLEKFLAVLCVLTAVVSGIAVLQYHQFLEIPGLTVLEQGAFDPSGQLISISRIRATGIFNDPNDLAMLTVVGVAFAAYGMAVPRWRPLLPVWIAVIGFFLYTLMLTHSRGGLLALAIAATVLFKSKFGWKKSIPLIVVLFPLAILLFGGRQTDFGGAVDQGTGQSRIQLWAGGLALLREHPVFGIGQEQFAEHLRQVAHNSFVQAFTELGVFGGSLFLGAFLYAIWAMYKVGDKQRCEMLDPRLVRMRPYLLAAVAGYAGAMLSLSRNYIVPTYLVLGLVAVYLRFARASTPLPELTLSPRLVQRLAFASVAFLAGTYVFVRVFARWSG